MGGAVKQFLASFKGYLNNVNSQEAPYQQQRPNTLDPAEKSKLGTRMLAILEPVESWINTHKYEMIDAQQNCIQKIQTERSASLCYTCSGRANEFFTGDSLHIHEMTCRTLIKGCSSSWWYLINYLDQVNRFNDAVKEIENVAGITVAEYNGIVPAKEVLSWAGKNNLRQNLGRCGDGLCEFHIAKNICENFISIERPIYLNQALNLADTTLKDYQLLKKGNYNPRIYNPRTKKSDFLSELHKIVARGFYINKMKILS